MGTDSLTIYLPRARSSRYSTLHDKLE